MALNYALINYQEHKEEQVEVQKYVSALQVKNQVIQAIPGVIYVLLAGPWSDRYGRKFLICCTLFGYIISNGVFIINLYFFYELKAEYLLFECLQGVCMFNSQYSLQLLPKITPAKFWDIPKLNIHV